MTRGSLAAGNPCWLEHDPCRHPLAMMLASRMSLDDDQVECAAGCGHRLCSDRGPVECACHLPAAKADALSRYCLRVVVEWSVESCASVQLTSCTLAHWKTVKVGSGHLTLSLCFF